MIFKPLIDTRTMQTIQPVSYHAYDYLTGWRLVLAAVAVTLIVLGVVL